MLEHGEMAEETREAMAPVGDAIVYPTKPKESGPFETLLASQPLGLNWTEQRLEELQSACIAEGTTVSPAPLFAGCETTADDLNLNLACSLPPYPYHPARADTGCDQQAIERNKEASGERCKAHR